jgi:ABC-type polysaccharide/polyol phosphate export permease
MLNLYDKFKNYYYKIKSILGLSLSLAKADFKLRNEGSYLGIFWYLLNPLALFLIMLFIKGVAFSSGFISFYPIYLFLGVIMNNFFSRSLSSSVGVVGSNGGLIKSIKIQYEPLVISEILESIFSHFFELFLLVIFMIYFKVSLIGIIYYLIIFAFFSIFLLGASFIFAVIGAYLNDFGNIWSIASQLIFFVTPTFYLLKKGTWLYKINLFNPLYYFLTAARDVTIYGKIPDLYLVYGIIFFSAFFFIVGILIFNKFKPKFAELV